VQRCRRRALGMKAYKRRRHQHCHDYDEAPRARAYRHT
jgi:hypothetical protein